ncbi:MAG: flagellar biosynthesis anti-sigma factor FlgM [Oscillospiraceae bacterium]|nr:flagellar biosynthesis anti-sigma factor FlgM [Oscillospiraceae bacterium]
MHSNSKHINTRYTSIDKPTFNDTLDPIRSLLKSDIAKCADPTRLDIIQKLIQNGEYKISSMDIADSMIRCKKNKKDGSI